MPDRIKVLPASEHDIGMAHPIDGQLDEQGSLWTYDDFTQRRLFDGSIVRFEQAPTIEKPQDGGGKTGKAAKQADV